MNYKIPKLKVPFFIFVLLYSVITLSLYNFVFWHKIYDAAHIKTVKDYFFIIQLYLILLAAYIALLSCVFFKYSTKILAIILLNINATATYFISHYGIMIDSNMLQNVFNTDFKEATDLLSLPLFGYIIALGIIPSFIIFKLSISYKTFWKEILSRFLYCTVLILFCATVIFVHYKEFSIFIRSNKHTMRYLIPRNYIYSLIKIGNSFSKQDTTIYKIDEDAKITHSSNPVLVVVIVGEAARKHNFSLYGYHKETNPYLKQYKDLILLRNATSCGTSTEVSLPCMFSHLERNHFINKKKKYEFLPSFLAKQNIDVLWLDNNFGGCKGTCNNVTTINTQDLNAKTHCSSGECLDGILVEQLDKKLKKPITQNTFIVLHQNGSHGPKYNKRYPKEFEKFKPICSTANLSKCSKTELTNAYDNTILYTDYIIHNVIKTLSTINTPSIMIYASDHGESLGENNIFLHGFPYIIAPKEQKEIPFLVWMSPSFIEKKNINHKINQKDSYSHDNIFHSILSIFDIHTSAYNRAHDILAP